jgi:hypothetical protein
MQTYEIPRDKWPSDVTLFGEAHYRWLVSIEVSNSEIGVQPEVRDMPLEGLSADPPAKGDTVTIFVERTPDDHLTRLISSPRRIYVEENDNGRDAAMKIESADGTSTLVNFMKPSAV